MDLALTKQKKNTIILLTERKFDNAIALADSTNSKRSNKDDDCDEKTAAATTAPTTTASIEPSNDNRRRAQAKSWTAPLERSTASTTTIHPLNDFSPLNLCSLIFKMRSLLIFIIIIFLAHLATVSLILIFLTKVMSKITALLTFTSFLPRH